jgi:hypothetical protein
LLRLSRREAERRERHPEPQPDPFGHPGEVAQQDLWRRAVRPPLSEVVFYGPDGVEAQRIRHPDLLNRLPVCLLLGLSLAVRMGLAPRFWCIDLVKHVELHRALLSVFRNCICGCRLSLQEVF